MTISKQFFFCTFKCQYEKYKINTNGENVLNIINVSFLLKICCKIKQIRIVKIIST